MTPSGIAGFWEGAMDERILGQPISRRGLLKVAGSIGIAGLASPWLSAAKVAASAKASAPRNIPIKHIVVDMQENRSFDHYYGFAPFVGRYGVPAHYSQPDGHGGSVAPYHFTSLSTQDIGHNWTATHGEYDKGKMDGFYTTDGINCMGYYTASDLPFYYSLFKDFTLCTNYFCSLLGPTWPNRFYVAAGTSGGITTNGLWGYGIFDYPIILDLLDAAGVTWKVYNVSWDSVPFGNTDNVFVFWQRWAHDQRTRGSKGEYLDDLRLGRLPQVSFIIPSFARGWDEHPPADVSVGMGIQVPTWVISPWAKPSHLEPTVYEHSSVLKFIEAVFGLPTLASVNHAFDAATPVGSNYQAAASGATAGPPAQPRDGRADIGSLLECFTF